MIHHYYNEHLLKLTAKAVIRSTPIADLQDYWHSFNESIDMNFCIEGNNLVVSVYDVVDGMTNTSDWFVIHEQTI
jgi:hypothetical protein